MARLDEGFEVTASPAMDALLAEAIVWTIGLPRPLVYAAVKVLRVIDYSTVARVLTRLGVPEVIDDVWSRFTSRAENVVTEVECPDTGDTIVLAEGPGEYTCPDCDAAIVVDDDGDAEHAYAVECPIEEEEFHVGPDEGAEYECPFCDGEVWIDDGEGHHAYAEVECPVSGDTIQLGGGEGMYTCPDCGEDIEVDDDGDAEHVEPSRRLAVSRTRR